MHRLALPLVLSILCLLALPSAAEAQTIISGGNIINRTWTTAGSPYVVQGDITVPAGAFLTIEAGVDVQFASTDSQITGLDPSRVELTVNGTLTVNGKNIRLTIPAGVKDGQVIRIKGQGGEGVNGGPNGDLILSFSIENNTKFKLDGDNLYATVDLDLYLAMLGGEIMVDTFDGKVKLKIKPETQSGTKVKLKGKGFPVYKQEGEFGDLYLTFQLKIPTNLTEKEKELFAELSKLRPI